MKVLKTIKFVDSPYKFTRLMVSITHAIIIYLVFTTVNQLTTINSDEITIYNLLLLAIINGGLWLFLESRNFEIDKIKNISIVTGLLLCLVSSFIISKTFTLGNITFIFIVKFAFWTFSSKKYTLSHSSLYTLKTFYLHAPILLFANILANYNESFKNYSLVINISTIIYIVLSLFVLYQLKILKNPIKSQNHKELDFMFVLGLVFIIFFLSMFSGLLRVPFSLLVYLAKKSLDILMLLLTPIAKFVIEGFYKLLKEPTATPIDIDNNSSDEEAYNPENYQFESFFDKEGPFTISVLLIAICIVLILIVSYKKMRKKSKGIEKSISPLIEDKEFLLSKEYLKNKVLESFNDLKDNFSAAYKKAIFPLNASVNEKIRHEYKLLLKFLHLGNFIENNNYTAKNISDILCQNYSSLESEVKEITIIYEDVRYSPKEFTKEDFKQFRSKIHFIQSKISKA